MHILHDTYVGLRASFGPLSPGTLCSVTSVSPPVASSGLGYDGDDKLYGYCAQPKPDESNKIKEESRAVAKKPRDAAAVRFGLEFARINYRCKSSHSSERQASELYTYLRKIEFNIK